MLLAEVADTSGNLVIPDLPGVALLPDSNPCHSGIALFYAGGAADYPRTVSHSVHVCSGVAETPARWTDQEMDLLQDLAAMVMEPGLRLQCSLWPASIALDRPAQPQPA